MYMIQHPGLSKWAQSSEIKKSVYFHTVNYCTQLHVLYLSAFALPGLPEVCLHTNHTLSKIYITEVINYTASVDIPIKKD